MSTFPAQPTRRSLLLGIAGFGVSAALCAESADAAQGTPSPVECLPTPPMTAGPYYLSDMPLRRDITEGLPGVPLSLRIRVATLPGCEAVEDAAVDLWHCDAAGVYSGVDGYTGIFLRGVQATDASGDVIFDTIYPGWYPGRTPHFHVLVRIGATEENGTMTGGNPVFAGQFYLDDALSDQIYAQPPYDERDNARRTRNDQDRIFMREPERERLILEVKPAPDATPTPDGALAAAAAIILPGTLAST
jgi:protocatechuate 3,4-dioxygenase beta subunit